MRNGTSINVTVSAARPIDQYEALQPLSMLVAGNDDVLFTVRYRTAVIAVGKAEVEEASRRKQV